MTRSSAGAAALVLWALLGVAVAWSTAQDPTPVERVVTLLQDMKTRIESDQKVEQASYDKFACWCEATTAAKAASITQLRNDLKSLGNRILELKGTIATLVSEIRELTSDIAKNEDAQKTATAVRSKENAAYLAEEAELEQAISALEKAITVLKSATSPSLRQTKADVEKWAVALARLKSTIAKLSPPSRPSADHILALSRVSAGYTPQSATIQGILQEMYDSFTATLQQLSSDEATRHTNYEALMDTYAKELAIMQSSLTKKQGEKIEAETELADGEARYGEMEKQLAADIEFFDATKASCVAKTTEWATRKSLRTEELAGISEALTILTSDEAKALFAKAIQPGVGAASFVQLRADASETPMASAQRVLKKHAAMAHSMRLAALAVEAGSVGHFEKVLTAIDLLLEQLAKEDKLDQDRVDGCGSQYQKLELALNDVNWKIKNNEAKKDKLTLLIDAAEAEKGAVVEQLAQVTNDIAYLEGNRTEENTKYKTDKTDDEQAIDLLEKAKAALEKYYADNNIAMGPLGNLLQLSGRGREPVFNGTVPEAKFSDKGHRKGEAKGVVALLANIIEDLQSELSTSKQAEEQAQLDYEKQHAAAVALQEELDRTKVGLETTIANRKTDWQDEDDKLKANEGDRTALEQTKTDIKPGCDFYIKNLAERRKKRDTEADGLRQAKQYLAGYRPDLAPAASALLQRKRRPAGQGAMMLDLDHVA